MILFPEKALSSSWQNKKLQTLLLEPTNKTDLGDQCYKPINNLSECSTTIDSVRHLVEEAQSTIVPGTRL